MTSTRRRATSRSSGHTSCNGSRGRWRADELGAEEGDDPGAGIASERLVTSGRGTFRDHSVEAGQIIGVVVVEEPVASRPYTPSHAPVPNSARTGQTGSMGFDLNRDALSDRIVGAQQH
jgi:hypothetical protein